VFQTFSWNLAYENECDWLSAFACENGQVTQISISTSARTIAGTMPPDACWLTALKTAQFYQTRFTGTLPSQLGWWSNLNIFDIRYNQLSGTVPTTVGAWTALEEAYFANNNLSRTVPSTVAAWTALEKANFAYNNLTGTMPDFGGGFCPEFGNGVVLRADCLNSTGKAKIFVPVLQPMCLIACRQQMHDVTIMLSSNKISLCLC
jgi:hypothetical protein